MTIARKNSKKLKPSHGNISISGSYEKQMKSFGEVLAEKMTKELLNGVPVHSALLEKGTRQEKRLCLTICDGNLELLKEKLEKNFDVFLCEDRKKPCLRVWGFPIEFVAPNAHKLKKEWSQIFSFIPRINHKADLDFIISAESAEQGAIDFVKEFRKEAEMTCPNALIRDKQKARNGSAKPGFILTFPIGSLQNKLPIKKVEDQRGLQEETFSAPPVKADKVETTENSVPVPELLALCFKHMSEEEKLQVLKSILPKGIGLYDTVNPLNLVGGQVTVRNL